MKRKAERRIPGERSSPRLKAKENAKAKLVVDLTDEAEDLEAEPQTPIIKEKEVTRPESLLEQQKTGSGLSLLEWRKAFLSRMRGQDVTLNKLSNILFDFDAKCRNHTGSDEKKMILTLFLSGTSGTGKTTTIDILLSRLGMTRDSETFVYKDMSKIRKGEDASMILGSAPSFAGYGEKNYVDKLLNAIGDKGIITTRTKGRGKFTIKPNKSANPPPVIFLHFEEVDKAHPSILTILINFLETGCLTSANGKEFVLPAQTRMIVVCTANYGKEEIAEMNHLTDFQRARTAVTDAMLFAGIEKPMIGRFPNILPYFPFEKKVADQIAAESISPLFDLVEFQYRDYFTKFIPKKGTESEALLTKTLTDYTRMADPELGKRSIDAICEDLKRELCCESMVYITEYLQTEKLPLVDGPVLDVLEFFPCNMEEEDYLVLRDRCQPNTTTYHLLNNAWEEKSDLLLLLVLWNEKIMTSVVVKSQPMVSNALTLITTTQKYCDSCHIACHTAQRVVSWEMIGSKIRKIFKNYCNLCMYNNSFSQGPKLLTAVSHG